MGFDGYSNACVEEDEQQEENQSPTWYEYFENVWFCGSEESKRKKSMDSMMIRRSLQWLDEGGLDYVW